MVSNALVAVTLRPRVSLSHVDAAPSRNRKSSPLTLTRAPPGRR